MLMNTLDRYIGKSILGAIFATLFTLVGLSAIIKFVEQFRSVGKGSYDIWQAVAYTGLTIPKDVETFFPMAALLGALIALGNLASRSELVVMQSAGFSRFKIGLAVMKTALPLVLFTMIIGEWGIPQTEQFARDMRTRALSGGSMLSVKKSAEDALPRLLRAQTPGVRQRFGFDSPANSCRMDALPMRCVKAECRKLRNAERKCEIRN